MCHYMFLCVTVCSCVSPGVTVCPCVNLCATVCPSVSQLAGKMISGDWRRSWGERGQTLRQVGLYAPPAIIVIIWSVPPHQLPRNTNKIEFLLSNYQEIPIKLSSISHQLPSNTNQIEFHLTPITKQHQPNRDPSHTKYQATPTK